MRFLNRRSRLESRLQDDDPLSGVANLFDLGLVFMVGLLVALLGAYRLDDLLREDSEVTITKRSADGGLEVIVKKGRRIEAMRVTKERSKGMGRRLGTAYRLEDGSMVYVPEEGADIPGGTDR